MLYSKCTCWPFVLCHFANHGLFFFFFLFIMPCDKRRRQKPKEIYPRSVTFSKIVCIPEFPCSIFVHVKIVDTNI